jgi:hypothetical protein
MADIKYPDSTPVDDPVVKDYKPPVAGSGIRVDGKPVKSSSKKDIDPLGEAADNTMKMIARKRATAEEAGKSKMNAMGDTYAKGGSASARADGCAQRGKTKGTIVMCGGGTYK